jgi:hypothetical protein
VLNQSLDDRGRAAPPTLCSPNRFQAPINSFQKKLENKWEILVRVGARSYYFETKITRDRENFSGEERERASSATGFQETGELN